MKKPEYIQNLESKENIFSVMVCDRLEGELLKYLNEKKLIRVYELSNIGLDGSISFNEVIFKSQQRFYLFVEKTGSPKFNLTIYYKVEQYNELYLFITQLLKQYKNATTNNRTN